MAAQEDWHQQGHPEVRLASIELLKNLKHELTKASLHAHVRRPGGIRNSAQGAGVNALSVLPRFLMGNPATHLSTQPESHTPKSETTIHKSYFRWLSAQWSEQPETHTKLKDALTKPLMDRSYLFFSIFISGFLALSAHAHTSCWGWAQRSVRSKCGYGRVMRAGCLFFTSEVLECQLPSVRMTITRNFSVWLCCFIKKRVQWRMWV